MTDGHSESIEHSRRNQGTELTKRDSGGLIARGLAELQQDDEQAAMWFRPAAEQGNASAQYPLRHFEGSRKVGGTGLPPHRTKIGRRLSTVATHPRTPVGGGAVEGPDNTMRPSRSTPGSSATERRE